MTIDSFINKKYKFEKSEHFEDYMKAFGVGFVLRKIGMAVSPVVGLQKENDYYILTSNSTFKHIVVRFKPGVEFEQETPDGRIVKAVLTIDGNTIHEVQTEANGRISTVDRIFSDEQVETILKVDDIIATRIYKRQA